MLVLRIVLLRRRRSWLLPVRRGRVAPRRRPRSIAISAAAAGTAKAGHHVPEALMRLRLRRLSVHRGVSMLLSYR